MHIFRSHAGFIATLVPAVCGRFGGESIGVCCRICVQSYEEQNRRLLTFRVVCYPRHLPSPLLLPSPPVVFSSTERAAGVKSNAIITSLSTPVPHQSGRAWHVGEPEHMHGGGGAPGVHGCVHVCVRITKKDAVELCMGRWRQPAHSDRCVSQRGTVVSMRTGCCSERHTTQYLYSLMFFLPCVNPGGEGKAYLRDFTREAAICTVWCGKSDLFATESARATVCGRWLSTRHVARG